MILQEAMQSGKLFQRPGHRLPMRIDIDGVVRWFNGTAVEFTAKSLCAVDWYNVEPPQPPPNNVVSIRRS